MDDVNRLASMVLNCSWIDRLCFNKYTWNILFRISLRAFKTETILHTPNSMLHTPVITFRTFWFWMIHFECIYCIHMFYLVTYYYYVVDILLWFRIPEGHQGGGGGQISVPKNRTLKKDFLSGIDFSVAK